MRTAEWRKERGKASEGFETLRKCRETGSIAAKTSGYSSLSQDCHNPEPRDLTRGRGKTGGRPDQVARIIQCAKKLQLFVPPPRKPFLAPTRTRRRRIRKGTRDAQPQASRKGVSATARNRKSANGDISKDIYPLFADDFAVLPPHRKPHFLRFILRLAANRKSRNAVLRFCAPATPPSLRGR